MKQIILYTLLIAALLTACYDDTFDSDRLDPKQINVSVSLVGEYPQAKVQTRGTPQPDLSKYTNRTITVVGIDKTVGDGTRDFNSSLYKAASWQLDPNHAYDGMTFDFYAFGSDLAAITTTVNNNGLKIDKFKADGKITYEVPTDVTKQPDLIVADMVKDKDEGVVDLTMYHALSAIGVVASSKHAGRQIESFTIKKVYSKGTMKIAKKAGESIQWENHSQTNPKFTSKANDKELGTELPPDNELTKFMNGNGYLMMIPQELPDGAQIEVVLWDGSTEASKSIQHYDIPPTTWEPGKKYIYYFDEPILKGVATYYEYYSNGEYGFYYYDKDNSNNYVLNTDNTIKTEAELKRDGLEIVDAGYGLLTPANIFTQFPSIYLGLEDNIHTHKINSTSKGNVVAQLKAFTGTELDCILYPVSQNEYPYSRTEALTKERRGMQPYYNVSTDKNIARRIEAGTSETGTGKPIVTQGYIMSNYAKAVFMPEPGPENNLYEIPSNILPIIRTPIQMRNISYQASMPNIYIQELETLDFSYDAKKKTLGNDILQYFRESIVIGSFGGTYNGTKTGGVPRTSAKISGLLIQTLATASNNTALFEEVGATGTISNMEMRANCVFINNKSPNQKSPSYIAAFAAENSGTLSNLINQASITNYSDSVHAGGICGWNIRLTKECINQGTISNQSGQKSNRTGGVVAYNAKGYDWNAPNTPREKFLEHERGDYKGIEDFPAALILNCRNEAKIIGSSYIGGIAGSSNYGGVIWKCTNTAKADVSSNGNSSLTTIYIGGIVGIQQCGQENNSATNPSKNSPPGYFTLTQECVNMGRVTLRSGELGNSLAVGGIVGDNDFAKGTEGDKTATEKDGYLPFANARVNRCVVKSTIITGRFSDTGGIAGLNNGSVNRSVCEQVFITGVFGNAPSSQRNSAGGIVGCNTNYVGDCLFIHNSPTSPISDSNTSGPFWSGSSVSGGIVGINNTYSKPLKSSSALVKKCIYAAVAPLNVRTQSEVGHFAPIAGYSGGYLTRDWEGKANMKFDNVDAISGATPLYTMDDNYFSSGSNQNAITAETFFNAPSAESDDKFGPFSTGRYPYGTIPISMKDVDLLPFDLWGESNGVQNWSFATDRPPYPVSLPSGYNTYSYTLPSAQGTAYILSGLVDAIKNQMGAVEYKPAIGTMKVGNTLRVTLNYIPNGLLAGRTEIKIDLTNVELISNQAGGYGQIFLRAPKDWKFADDQTSPKPYKVMNKSGNVEYWFCLVTKETSQVVTMRPI